MNTSKQDYFGIAVLGFTILSAIAAPILSKIGWINLQTNADILLGVGAGAIALGSFIATAAPGIVTSLKTLYSNVEFSDKRKRAEEALIPIYHRMDNCAIAYVISGIVLTGFAIFSHSNEVVIQVCYGAITGNTISFMLVWGTIRANTNRILG